MRLPAALEAFVRVASVRLLLSGTHLGLHRALAAHSVVVVVVVVVVFSFFFLFFFVQSMSARSIRRT